MSVLLSTIERIALEAPPDSQARVIAQVPGFHAFVHAASGGRGIASLDELLHWVGVWSSVGVATRNACHASMNAGYAFPTQGLITATCEPYDRADDDVTVGPVTGDSFDGDDGFDDEGMPFPDSESSFTASAMDMDTTFRGSAITLDTTESSMS